MRTYRIAIPILTFCLFAFGQIAAGQFKEDAFSQSYNNDDASESDSVDVMFSIPEYFGGLSHKNELKIGNSFAGSVIIVGGQQIYNRQYWKLPLVYGSIAAGVGGGLYFRNIYNQSLSGEVNKKASTISTACFVGAGLAYWGTLMDGVFNYKPDNYPVPGKATLYSLLLPGLGQIYNGEFWKLPVYWGGMIGSLHFYSLNRKNYERFRSMYNRANDPNWTEEIPVSVETSKHYRDVYRRYRDYSLVAVLGFYLLQVIDANVFSYMHNFDTGDDFALTIEPAVLMPDSQFAFNSGSSALGLRLGFTF